MVCGLACVLECVREISQGSQAEAIEGHDATAEADQAVRIAETSNRKRVKRYRAGGSRGHSSTASRGKNYAPGAFTGTIWVHLGGRWALCTPASQSHTWSPIFCSRWECPKAGGCVLWLAVPHCTDCSPPPGLRHAVWQHSQQRRMAPGPLD